MTKNAELTNLQGKQRISKPSHSEKETTIISSTAPRGQPKH